MVPDCDQPSGAWHGLRLIAADPRRRTRRARLFRNAPTSDEKTTRSSYKKAAVGAGRGRQSIKGFAGRGPTIGASEPFPSLDRTFACVQTACLSQIAARGSMSKPFGAPFGAPSWRRMAQSSQISPRHRPPLVSLGSKGTASASPRRRRRDRALRGAEAQWLFERLAGSSLPPDRGAHAHPWP
jgi:hypothetical protein